MTMFEPATPIPSAALAALLRWYDMAGVDGFVGETARNRFEETAVENAARKATARPPQTRSVAAPAAAPPVEAQARQATPAAIPAWTTPVPGTVAADDARDMARHAASLADLQAAYAAFEGCALKATAKSLVFGNGAENASLMLIGEAPGREEDIAGEPFVGRSGQLLNRMLAAIGVERTDVRVTNIIAWRPPGNRAPTPAETEMCLPFVLRQIELVAPKVVVCLGSPSAKAILSSNDGIMKLRGRWNELSLPGLPAPIQATALLHPAYLLRQPAQKRLAWRDLLAVKDRLHRD
ncbi:uracil-DNA glycosylase [Aureimonas altamirensis]|uniref:uracil-DNA glycosylase n=1 Tax=Aureimonas altamirensis TaxID=370622 RepID=UPI003015C1BC